MEDICRCKICGFDGDWDATDEVHGTMWGCDRCNMFFCEKCFIDKLGRDSYLNMVSADEDKILCPDCYAKDNREEL